MSGRKAAALLFPLFLILAGLFAATRKEPEPEVLTRDTFLLDTFCEISIFRGGGEAAMEKGLGTLQYYNDLFSPDLEGSDLLRINRRGEGVSRVDIRKETAELLRLGREFCVLSGGALEPAIKPLTECWDFTVQKEVPDAALLEERARDVKSLMWDVEEEVDASGDTQYFFAAYDPAVRIDAGAFAKGFIADRVKDALTEQGVTSGIINLGGNVLLIGSKPDGSPFRVGIRADSAAQGEKAGYASEVSASDISVVTAGTYERCFEKDGVRYHHILDPKTGWPVQNGLTSVTVYGPESGVCDALCTAIFVLGEEKGQELLDAYDREHGGGYKAFFLRTGK